MIGAPHAVSPSGKLSTNQPDFRAVNGAISGTSGVGYRFEVSRDTRTSSQIGGRRHGRRPTAPATTTDDDWGPWPYERHATTGASGASHGRAESDYSNTLSFTTSDPTGTPPPLAADRPRQSDSASWSTDQWETCVHGSRAPSQGRPDACLTPACTRCGATSLARGADFQNGWRGDVRPRHLPAGARLPDREPARCARPCSYRPHRGHWRATAGHGSGYRGSRASA